MATIAITAASGQLGSEIIRATCALGDHTVVGLARTPKNAKSLDVEVRPGDYQSPEDLVTSLQGVDSLLLVSGNDAPEKRIDQHRNVINAAKQAGVSKIVYTSVQGAEEGTAFSPVIESNRQTEEDIRNSDLDWVVGRNGVYIEPDVEYIDKYKQAGEIANCAGDGKCGYTTRSELAYAYARLITESTHHGRTFNLHGKPLTQHELAEYLNRAFGTNLVYRSMSVEDYRADRVSELGEFMGQVIAGIYEGIRAGKAENASHYSEAVGREHQSWDDYFDSIARHLA